MKLTIAIISKSEIINKVLCESIGFADEIIVVVDSPAKKSKKVEGVSYYFRPLGNDFASQRNFALEKAHGDWVLFVDDDEYVGTELSREIKESIQKSNYVGYFIKRIDVCYHQPLLHGETGSIKLLRLARRTAGKYSRPVHEIWQVTGKIGELSSPLYHAKDGLAGSFITRMSQYADIDADALIKENKPFSYTRLLLNPKAKFIQNYFGRLGFMDGTVGLIVAYLMSVQSLTVRVFQWTKRN
jgi:(heptosyl)LPS beta-1,4-glucosyltransferase